MKIFMRFALCCVAVGCMVLVLAMAATAQAPAPTQKPNGSKYNQVKYDKSAEATIIGTVEEVVDFDCPVSGAEGNHVVLATAQGKVMVHVAPVKFLKQYGIVLNKGDKLTITGAKLRDADGNDTMIARTITSDQVMISVRDPNGKPLW
jgi:hypothetical protein